MKTLKTLIAEKNANVESLIGMIDAGRFANEFDLDDYLDDHFPEEVGMLARGSFGIVLIGDRDRPDWVLKKQQKEDKPYEAFLDIAQANRGRNPHFPKIRKRFSLDGAKFTIIEHVETDDVACAASRPVAVIGIADQVEAAGGECAAFGSFLPVGEKIGEYTIAR